MFGSTHKTTSSSTALCPLLSPPPLASAPPIAWPSPCSRRTLDELVGDGSCLRRLSLGAANRTTLPVYVAVVPVLAHRLATITRRLEAAGAPDVTFVECANREDVQRLPPAQRACLHPHGVRTEWTMPEHLANGTLSLAVKHTLTFRDLLRRRLPAALMLEDDALVPASLWASLAPYALPCDADLFWLTAYRQNMGVFALGSPRRARRPRSPPRSRCRSR